MYISICTQLNIKTYNQLPETTMFYRDVMCGDTTAYRVNMSVIMIYRLYKVGETVHSVFNKSVSLRLS